MGFLEPQGYCRVYLGFRGFLVFEKASGSNVGALIIRIGFGDTLYYSCNSCSKELSKPYSSY